MISISHTLIHTGLVASVLKLHCLKLVYFWFDWVYNWLFIKQFWDPSGKGNRCVLGQGGRVAKLMRKMPYDSSKSPIYWIWKISRWIHAISKSIISQLNGLFCYVTSNTSASLAQVLRCPVCYTIFRMFFALILLMLR